MAHGLKPLKLMLGSRVFVIPFSLVLQIFENVHNQKVKEIFPQSPGPSQSLGPFTWRGLSPRAGPQSRAGRSGGKEGVLWIGFPLGSSNTQPLASTSCIIAGGRKPSCGCWHLATRASCPQRHPQNRPGSNTGLPPPQPPRTTSSPI